jgi:hypothetical protein
MQGLGRLKKSLPTISILGLALPISDSQPLCIPHHGKAICITYSECLFVALSIQHAMRTRHIVICGLPPSTIIFHIISQTTLLQKKKKKGY